MYNAAGNKSGRIPGKRGRRIRIQQGSRTVEQSALIPVVIGVTGHLDIRESDREVLRSRVREELEKIRNACPDTPVKMLSGLARGADLLCAEVAEEAGIPLIAALPMEADVYAENFSGPDREKMLHYIRAAESAFVAPAAEKPAEGMPEKDFAYRQAGIYTAAHSHALIALWDGKEDRKTGCGTAAAVGFALRGDWEPESGMASRYGENETVIHIMAPREGTEGAAGEVRMLGNTERFRQILADTEEFNRLDTGKDDPGYGLFPDEKPEDEILLKTEKLYQRADGLSLRSAKKFRQALAWSAVAGTGIAMAFLLYDEMELIWMMLVCGMMLVFAWGCKRWAVRCACHRRYIDYRILAEALRVQAFLRYAGSTLEVQDLLSWTVQHETPWILCAISALNACPGPARGKGILSCWVEEQRKYHESAARKTRNNLDRNDRLLRIATIASIGLYIGGLAWELLCGGVLARPLIPVGQTEIWRVVLKVALGSISAGTLFLSNYYGRMSLPRRESDHVKMVELLQKTADQMIRHGENERLLAALAREELTENGNWSSYQRDNTPDLVV